MPPSPLETRPVRVFLFPQPPSGGFFMPGGKRVSEEELSSDARRAADAAVKKVFAILGVDIDDPESVENFRADLRFGSRLRRAAEHGQMTLVGALIMAFVSACWIGLAELVKRSG